MKYIRTNDGIYKYADYLGIHNGKRYALMDDTQGNRITMCQEPEKLCKIADTIEELCDEFVLETKCGGYYIGNLESRFGELMLIDYVHNTRWSISQGKVFAAIWTEWGLKYVARLTKEGWELV